MKDMGQPAKSGVEIDLDQMMDQMANWQKNERPRPFSPRACPSTHLLVYPGLRRLPFFFKATLERTKTSSQIQTGSSISRYPLPLSLPRIRMHSPVLSLLDDDAPPVSSFRTSAHGRRIAELVRFKSVLLSLFQQLHGFRPSPAFGHHAYHATGR